MIRLLTIALAVYLGCLVTPAKAQFGNFQFGNRVNSSTRNLPLRSLDKRITYPADQLSLIADLENQDKDRADIYLINSTKEKVPLENGIATELPIVLEAQTAPGIWERAEVRNDKPRLRPSTATDSILPSYYRKRTCRCWQSGQPIRLRYALYSKGQPTITSESFDGFLPLGVIDDARYDLMSQAVVPESLRIRYVPETTTYQEVADEWFGKLSLLKAFGPAFFDQGEAQKWASSIHDNPVASREERDVAIRLQKWILNNPLPQQYDRSKLVAFCQEAVGKNAPNFSPKLRSLSWIVLQEWVNTGSRSEAANLARFAWDVIQNAEAPTSEKKQATAFLCSDKIADVYSPILSAPDRDRLSLDQNPHRRIVNANWMLRQRRKGKTSMQKKVHEFYQSIDLEKVSAYEIVSILHFDRLYSPYTDPRWELWLKAIDIDSEYALSQLSIMYEFDQRKFPRKYKLTNNLPNTVKAKLYEYIKEDPKSKAGEWSKKLLENSKAKAKRYGGFDFRL